MPYVYDVIWRVPVNLTVLHKTSCDIFYFFCLTSKTIVENTPIVAYFYYIRLGVDKLTIINYRHRRNDYTAFIFNMKMKTEDGKRK